MASLKQIRKRFEDLLGQEQKLAAEALQESEDLVVKMVAGQLEQGIKSDGSKVVWSYTPQTIAQKKQRTGIASITDHLTNYDTGESYQKLYMEVKGQDIEFGTKTDRDPWITDRMDGQAFKPNEKSRVVINVEKAHPLFMGKIRSKLKL